MSDSPNPKARVRRSPGLMLVDANAITTADVERRRQTLERLRRENDERREHYERHKTETPTPEEPLDESQLNALLEMIEHRQRPELYEKAQRRHRQNIERAVIRARLEDEFPDLDEGSLEAKIDLRFARQFPQDPRVQREYRKIEAVSASPSSAGITPQVEIHAMRQVDEACQLERLLTASVGPLGRPSDRELARATFECILFESGPPVVNKYYKRFQVRDEATAWAYGYPARTGSNRNLSNVYEMLHAKLQSEDPDICIKLMVSAILKIREKLGDPDIGRYIAIDGTDVPAARDQRWGDPKGEDALLRRGISSASWSSHGPSKWWRGALGLGIFDIKTNMSLAWGLFEGKATEYLCIEDLLLKIHEYWLELSGEPWAPEFVVADRGFDNDTAHRMFEQKFGIHLVCPRSIALGLGYEHREGNGTPLCAEHGPMKLKQSDNFVDSAKRNQLGIPPGEEIALNDAFHRWVCVDPNCLVKEVRVYWKKGPRAYPYLPFCGEHSSRIALRDALLRKRNVAESLIGQLKRRGIANGKMLTPRWVSSDREMEWVAYAAVLAHSLQRLVHLEDGPYAASYAEAEGLGLLSPCEPPAELAA